MTVRSVRVLAGLVVPALLASLLVGAAAHALGIPHYPSNIDTSQHAEVEPNGTAATATALTLQDGAAHIVGNIVPKDDYDYYAFAARAGDRVYAATRTSGGVAGVSTLLELLGDDGDTVIEVDNDDGTFEYGASSIAGATIPADGTYYLSVTSEFRVSEIRPYHVYFQLRSGTPATETEPNDTLPGEPLPAGRWVAGAIATATDADYYSIALDAGDTVYLSLDLDPERNGDTNLQVGIGPFDGRMLTVNDSGAGSPVYNAPDSEAHFLTVKEAGTYSIVVSAPANGVVGTYHLGATVLPRVRTGVSCRTYTSTVAPIAVPDDGTTVSSSLTVPDDVRIADLDVAIRGTHEDLYDLGAELISPAGNRNFVFNRSFLFLDGLRDFDVVLDDEAALPSMFDAAIGMRTQPQELYRLSRFDGESAGGTWTLVMRDQRPGDVGTITGWGLEVCAEPPPPPCAPGFAAQTVYATDFETGPAGFGHAGVADEWELGLPETLATATVNAVARFDSCASGTACWKTDLDGTYEASSSQDLASPVLDLRQYGPPLVVRWAHRYQMDTSTSDRYYASILDPAWPTSALRLFEYYDGQMATYVGPEYTGQTAGWSRVERRVDAMAGRVAQLVFHVDSNLGAPPRTNFAGVAIDDVSVTACFERNPIYANGFELP